MITNKETWEAEKAETIKKAEEIKWVKGIEKELTTNCEKLNLSHRIIRIVRKDYFGEEELLDVIEVKHIRQFIRDLKKSNWQYWENSWGEQQRIFSIGENDINTLIGDELK